MKSMQNIPVLIAVSSGRPGFLLPGLKEVLYDAGSDHGFRPSLSSDRFNPEDRYRLVVVKSEHIDPDEIYEKAEKIISSWNQTSPVIEPPIFLGSSIPYGKLALLFPGQGSQYIGMGAGLRAIFTDIDISCESAQNFFSGDKPLADYVYITDSQNDLQDAEFSLRRTNVAQPAIGALSAGFLSVIKRFKVDFNITAGHSFGELTALMAAGWLQPDDFFWLASQRGSLMDAACGPGKGAMLAVIAPIEKIKRLLEDFGSSLILANINSPSQGVVSGHESAIKHFAEFCKEKRIRCVLLPVSAAFHSPLVNEAAVPFSEQLGKIKFSPTGIDVYSNTTGDKYPLSPEAARELLSRQLTSPVDFMGEIEAIFRDGARTFVEVGPKGILTGLVRSILKGSGAVVTASNPSAKPEKDLLDFAHCIATCAVTGHLSDPCAWNAFVRP